MTIRSIVSVVTNPLLAPTPLGEGEHESLEALGLEFNDQVKPFFDLISNHRNDIEIDRVEIVVYYKVRT